MEGHGGILTKYLDKSRKPKSDTSSLITTIDTLFATSFMSFGITVLRVSKAFGGKGIIARRRGLSWNDVLACLDVLGDVKK